jgi:hypothetical protein
MIVIPHQLLPDARHARAERLRNYFTNQIVSSVLTNEGWSITLNWPTTADYYVDPRLMEGLHWWSHNLGVGDIPFAVRQESKWQLSLFDSWTLLSWSRWLAACAANNALPNEVILLHVDDHDDLMSPHLWSNQDGWSDAITHEPVDLLVPETVFAAITSGAIGIGSFIVPLLYQIPKVHVRHLCATGYSYSRQGVYCLERITTPDDLLASDMLRPTVRLGAIAKSLKGNPNDLSTYSASAKPEEWLQSLPNAPILLHLDLDYFNNRFNCDSDWEFHPSRHDPASHEILSAIDSVFNALSLQGALDRIVDVTVALSPGFFPAEFWSLATERIHHYIDQLWIIPAA